MRLLPRDVRTGSIDSHGVLAAVVDITQLDNHVAGTSDQTVVLLMVCTSGAFLLPAYSSFRIGGIWHAWVFGLMALFCGAYHACETSLPSSFSLQDGCSDLLRHTLEMADTGWMYFVFLQMTYLVMGPEDPRMQWIDHPVISERPRSALGMTAPLDAVVVTRIVPIVAIFSYICTFQNVDDLHWHLIILDDVLLLFGCSAFWLHRDRRSSMPKVLLRLRFWRRLWIHCVMPMLVGSSFFVLMQSSDSRAMHSLWHLLVAGLAGGIIRSVSCNVSKSPYPEADIMNVSPQNPVVPIILLGSVSMFGLPTIIASLVLDWWAVGYWRWPLVCTGTNQLPGGYLVVIGALPTLLALAFAFWLISSTVGRSQSDPAEIALSKQIGCSLGYMSVVFGFLTLATPDPFFPAMHTLFMILFLSLMMVATLLTTLSARYPLAPGARIRCGLTLTIFVTVLGFLMLCILVHVPNAYYIPHPLLASSEYAALILPMIWPLTWVGEVQARWQAHKVWRTVWPNQMA
mmetsp:Transcript_135967/g.221298  ORF Transcript_135967/g.221298 Transcript_135967/m.221298 type:complete len:514 (-) Transcript_135967:199-1740(-)